MTDKEKENEKLTAWMKRVPPPAPRPGLEERLIHRLRESSKKKSPFLVWGTLSGGLATVFAGLLFVFMIRDQRPPMAPEPMLKAQAKNEFAQANEMMDLRQEGKISAELDRLDAPAVKMKEEEVQSRRRSIGIKGVKKSKDEGAFGDGKFLNEKGFKRDASRSVGAAQALNAPTLFWAGAISEISEKQFHAVRNEREWAFLWEAVHQNISPLPLLPKVNFPDEMVVAVFLGERPSAGYSVWIEREERIVTGSENRLRVIYKTGSPPKDAMTASILTSPYYMKVIPAFTGYVDFVEEK